MSAPTRGALASRENSEPRDKPESRDNSESHNNSESRASHESQDALQSPGAAATMIVSVIIPARNEAAAIAGVVHAVRAQQLGAHTEIEVIVVDDGSSDDTAERAAAAGARVVRRGESEGNPAAARNAGARAARGDPLVFLDADCTPAPGWLDALLSGHARGAAVVGGALEMAPGLPITARCDYYATSTQQHARRPAGRVVSQSPASLSVRRDAFFATCGFIERHPVADGHEELAWQGALTRAGEQIIFEPRAVAYHRNRAGLAHLLRRSYRWGYSSIEAKALSGAARVATLYRHPRLLVAAALPLSAAHTLHALTSWMRAGRVEPLVLAPGILAARIAYACGMMIGGIRWLRRTERSSAERSSAERTSPERTSARRTGAEHASTGLARAEYTRAEYTSTDGTRAEQSGADASGDDRPRWR
ncbi:MAG TPA: glycosyltransferase [Gemmatimonadaceae bacterium]|nr:glycosyltransferase [Gemmatimonadaceae bacterium]